MLADLFNCSFTSGKFPDLLKASLVKPLLKKGDLTKIENYRPISLLCFLSKVLEKVMYDRLVNFLNATQFFSQHQHGFLKDRSTNTALYDLTKFITEAVDSGDAVLGCSIDMTKAFDSASHSVFAGIA
uniref:RNA-directed DNA polymerase from mobile element jockey n=1 Tax=Lygus hesperus TaxID=30085 RepID=A0A0A9W9Y8_LYGHE